MSHRRTASDSSAGDYNSAASAHSDWEAEHGDVEGHAGPHPPNGHVASGHALGHGHVHVHAHAHAPHDGLASAEAAAAAAAVAAAGIPGQIAYSVDWHNERQRLPPQVGAGAARRPEERWAAVLALRSAVLAPGTGADDADTVEREARASVLRVRPLRCSVARVQCRAPLPSAFAHHPLVAGPLRRGAGALPARPGLRRARGGDHVPGAQAVAARVWLERGPPHVERAAGPAQELTRFFIYVMDSITSACGPGGQFRLLVDLRGVSSANADVRAMRVAFNVLQKGFPERVAHLWLAEPPAVFAGLWRLISPLVAPSTRAKINFCAGADVGKVVGRHVDAALLPPDWGGTTPLRPLTAGPPPWAPPDGAARPRKY